MFSLLLYRQSCWKPNFELYDANGQKIFHIVGPCCICHGIYCTCDFPFEIYTATGSREEPVGRIAKQWSGLVKEMFTDATNFSVSCKLLIGVFLIFSS